MSEEERKFLEIVDLKRASEAVRRARRCCEAWIFCGKGWILCAARTVRLRKVHTAQYHRRHRQRRFRIYQHKWRQAEGYEREKLTQYRRKHLGYVFQMYNLIANLNVKENIEVGAYLSDNALDIDELLHTLGLYEHRYKLPNQLSGGQQQRVSIGRAIVKILIYCSAMSLQERLIITPQRRFWSS